MPRPGNTTCTAVGCPTEKSRPRMGGVGVLRGLSSLQKTSVQKVALWLRLLEMALNTQAIPTFRLGHLVFHWVRLWRVPPSGAQGTLTVGRPQARLMSSGLLDLKRPVVSMNASICLVRRARGNPKNHSPLPIE